MRVTSLGFRTDLALRVLEGATISDRGAYLVIRSPGNPDYWWGNFLLLRDAPGTGGPWLARFAEEFPAARRRGLAGTLVWHAGRYGRAVLRARTLVIVADPADAAIRIYCACGLTDRESRSPSSGHPPDGVLVRACSKDARGDRPWP